MTAEPFADPDTGAANDAGDFLTNEELIGRHVLIVPKAIELIKAEPGSTWPDGREKKDYTQITADIVILDGRKNPKIKQFPHIERDKHISAFKIIAELKKYVGTGTPVLGYWTQVNKGYFLEPADAEVKAAQATRNAWERYEDQRNGQSVPQSTKPPF